VQDFEAIEDSKARAECESRALEMARRLLTEPQRFRSIGAAIEAVSRMKL
jgi:5-methylthioribose kinase